MMDQNASPACVSSQPHLSVVDAASSAKFADLQGAPRFPIRLPITIKSRDGNSTFETQNVSANGLLFEADTVIPVGSSVDFILTLPAAVTGAASDVAVDCHGRVVRSLETSGRMGVGVVIDQYRFERQ